MRKNYFLMSLFAFLISLISFGQQAENFFLDFEGASPLTALPTGVTNVNGTNTIRVKNTTDYTAIPNAVQTDPDATGEKELFLDFQGYLKMDIADASAGFSIAYDYRRNDLNDDWFLGFLTFIGNEGATNKIDRLLIRKFSGQLLFGGTSTGTDSAIIGFNTNYHIVVTVSNIGDLIVYVNNAAVLTVLNSASNRNLHTWTNASLLLSFKGDSFDGTNVTPENEFALNARDARVFVDNIALFERALSTAEVKTIYTNGNNAFSQPATEVAFLDFEGASPLTTLPSGITNVNGTNTIKIKNNDTKVYPAIPNAVQADPDVAGEKELFLDFQGYLKMNVSDPSDGFSVSYDYRRNNLNDDWNLGFLTFIGNDGTTNRLDRLRIGKFSGELNFEGTTTGTDSAIISFNTNYHVVVTVNNRGDLIVYVNNVAVLDVPNSTSNRNFHTWTNASLLLSFKGQDFDGTNVTPENKFATDARDARVFVDNVALFSGPLSAPEVATLFNNGNNSLSVNKFTGTNSNWNDANNWTFSAIPLATNTVEIPASKTVNVDVTSATTSNLIVDGILNINTGQALDIKGNLNTNGSFTINNGGSLLIDGTSTGNITYKRALTADPDPIKNWHLVSSPVSGQTVVNFIANNTLASGTTNTNFRGIANYKIDGSPWNFYVSTYAGADAFDAGKGYSVKKATAGDVNFTGTYTAGNKEYAINQTTNDFNLVGNPFASYIKLGTFFIDNDATTRLSEQTIWLWNPNKLGAGLGGYDQKMSGTDASFEIAPGQGFFVSSGAAASNKVTFNSANQSHKADTFLKNARTEIHLNLNQNSLKHQTKVYYIEGTSKDFDNGFDGSMFNGVNYDLAVFSQLVSNNQGKNLGIQSLPNSDFEKMIIPIGVKAVANKEITFSAAVLNLPTGIKVFLEDKATNTFTRLDEANSTYKITLTTDVNGIGRFYLHTAQNTLSTKENETLENISIYKADNSTLRIIGLEKGKISVSLYTIVGEQVLNTSFEATSNYNVPLPKLATGVYIVKLQTEKGTLNKKIILE